MRGDILGKARGFKQWWSPVLKVLVLDVDDPDNLRLNVVAVFSTVRGRVLSILSLDPAGVLDIPEECGVVEEQ